MLDPHAVLGVARDASPETVRRAFKRAVRMNHPDLHPGDPAASERLRRIVAAYERVASWQGTADTEHILVRCQIRGADLFGALACPRSAMVLDLELRALDACGICGGVGFEEIASSFWRATRFECEVCNGGGLLRVERRVRVRIPIDAESAARIRLRGIGLPRAGSARGDAILSLRRSDG